MILNQLILKCLEFDDFSCSVMSKEKNFLSREEFIDKLKNDLDRSFFISYIDKDMDENVVFIPNMFLNLNCNGFIKGSGGYDLIEHLSLFIESKKRIIKINDFLKDDN